MVAIAVLVAGLLHLIPKEIKDEVFKVLTTQSKRAATDLLCDQFVVPRLGVPRPICHKIAEGLIDKIAATVRAAIGG